jgi:hypothetical protein
MGVFFGIYFFGVTFFGFFTSLRAPVPFAIYLKNEFINNINIVSLIYYFKNSNNC